MKLLNRDRRPVASEVLPSREAGMSIIEVLIASLLLFLVVMGLLPLFARSAVSNAMGSDLTQVSNLSKSQVELLYQAPFNSPLVTVPAGQAMLQTRENWDAATKRFVLQPAGATDPTVPPRWVRFTSVRQYSLPPLVEGEVGTLDDYLLDGNAAPENVQLKEVEVVVVSYSNAADPTRSGLGPVPGSRIIVRTLKPF